MPARFLSFLTRRNPRTRQGEYYLTDVVGLAREAGLSARVVLCEEEETLGVNTRADLARAEAVFQARKRQGGHGSRRDPSGP